uniref:NADH-ubiquinone oxidoreductase chain 4 n=1 Tax=Echinococcus oligarthrus TaxID=6212 RepID=A4PBC1_ECHOL|nr:NADH dehydrogenase subunit 4 [Echinococcus oligarthrus]BAF56513.1 NADH dehydrogenase subunit 4 [Echinococcus oligarthrus]
MGMFILFSIGWFLIIGIILLLCLLYSVGVGGCLFMCVNVFNELFVFDSISFYLIVLVLLLGLYSQVMFFGLLTVKVRFFLVVSMVFAVICFCINHSVLFWCVYELSMFPLLYLIFSESPYSERFLASWYFSGYLLVTSLPLILILLYLSYVNGSFFFSEWCCVDGNVPFSIFYVLSFVFFTKVPLVPFHTWLPVVHAEAISIVSIFLSGYIMKLGLLGVYRSTFFVFDLSFVSYLFVCCLISVGFLVIACGELDGKRWLAFLSLSHIVVPFFGFFVSDWVSVGYSFFYCLGHGLSAGLVFGLLWCFYDVSNTRNWILLKSGIGGVVSVIIVVLSVLSLCSFPITIQFFCEVYLIGQCFGVLFYLLFWVCYLFFGGLVPLILCGHLLIRSEYYESVSVSYYCYYYYLCFLIFWCFFGIIFL